MSRLSEHLLRDGAGSDYQMMKGPNLNKPDVGSVVGASDASDKAGGRSPRKLSRREFLIGSGAVGALILLGDDPKHANANESHAEAQSGQPAPGQEAQANVTPSESADLQPAPNKFHEVEKNNQEGYVWVSRTNGLDSRNLQFFSGGIKLEEVRGSRRILSVGGQPGCVVVSVDYTVKYKQAIGIGVYNKLVSVGTVSLSTQIVNTSLAGTSLYLENKDVFNADLTDVTAGRRVIRGLTNVRMSFSQRGTINTALAGTPLSSSILRLQAPQVDSYNVKYP